MVYENIQNKLSTFLICFAHYYSSRDEVYWKVVVTEFDLEVIPIVICLYGRA